MLRMKFVPFIQLLLDEGKLMLILLPDNERQKHHSKGKHDAAVTGATVTGVQRLVFSWFFFYNFLKLYGKSDVPWGSTVCCVFMEASRSYVHMLHHSSPKSGIEF